ncbi:SDR family NAD(P)-dependent oxidoreductase [Phenylobacterium sp.]|uniref:SDR family NAD(P)-dependent oxidoreductase n=1 Tax=Phenylobacterium sp. TaxID=1871053 RepID=UPI0035B3DA34
MGDILDLKGRNALVTGAGQGVGRQVALQFAAHNAGVVVVNDFYAERAQAVAAEVQALGARAIAAPCDVTDYDAVQRMFTDISAQIGAIDLLVNNAGNAGPTQSPAESKPFWETGPQEWSNWMGTNFYGVLNCCRAATPGMMARKYGRIITVISDAGRVGEPHLAVYSGAKAGAAGFMRALAKAVGRGQITANCVALAGVNTPGVADLMPDAEHIKQMLKAYVIRRFGEPDDAANMILFLASDAASWITAQTYPVNGGYSVSS